MRDAGAMAADLLAWYDRNARVMPWRVGPAERAAGVRPDPYRVWLSEVMLQQTTVAAVRGYFLRFIARWPDVQALAAAEDGAVMAEWAGLGYYARARNLLACARAVAAAGGRFPDTEEGLRALPGVGRYTAAAVAAIAFDRRAVVVDGNVERVMARLHAIETPLPGAKPALTEHAAVLTPATRPGDHAQAVMDLGATVCTPRRPACGLCPWSGDCAARARGLTEALPAKAPKTPRPLRQGMVWAARRSDGAWLLERRPGRGMLGGMLGFPGTAWDRGPAGADDPPLAADWRPAGGVRHVFSHFELDLAVLAADAGPDARPQRGAFVAPGDFGPGDLPSVMRKALDVASRALSPR